MSWASKAFKKWVVNPISQPIRSIAVSEPLAQAISGHDVSFNPDKNLDAAIRTTYQTDPVAQTAGIKEDDAAKAAKIVAAAAAIYFTAGAASAAIGEVGTTAGTAAGETGAGWVSAEGGASYAGGLAADAATTGATTGGVISGASDISVADSALPSVANPSSTSITSLMKDANQVLGLANTANNLLNKSRNKSAMPSASFLSSYGDSPMTTPETAKQNVMPNVPSTMALPATLFGMPTKTVIIAAVVGGALLYLAYKNGMVKDVAKAVA
jgi:hypothetical protein